MFLINVNIISVILFSLFKLTVTRVIFSSDFNFNNIDNTIDNSIENDTNNYFNFHNTTSSWLDNNDSYDDDDDYEYELECELSEMPPEPDTMCCGIDVSSSNRVVGGSATLLQQYPWLALIEYENKITKRLRPKCGGSLISGLYVLTAGHCVAGSMVEANTPVNVVLGDYNKYNDGPDCIQEKSGKKICSDGEVRIAIENTLVHRFFHPKSLDNDIALIKLTEMAPYTDSIRPICLPTLDLTMTEHRNLWLSIAGWGYMKQEKSEDTGEYTGETSAVKRDLRMPYVPLEKCSQKWAITKYHICAGGLAGQDACMGDSGGPLMYNNDGQYELAGAVSFGASKPCGKANVPGVYTNVYRYHDWIMDVIKEGKMFDDK